MTTVTRDITISLAPAAHKTLETLAASHLMTHRAFLGAALAALEGLSKTERVLLLGQLDEEAACLVAEAILRRCGCTEHAPEVAAVTTVERTKPARASSPLKRAKGRIGRSSRQGAR